jgi:hypothetical protein
MTMGLPKISGILNNCALNCALPSLIEQIKLYSEAETNSSLPNIDDNNSLFQNYALLKALFAKHYGLAPEALSWTTFSEFIQHRFADPEKHEERSFSEQEYLFAPVLRKFYEHNLKKASYQNTSHLSNIHHNGEFAGRYEMLEYADFKRLFYEAFHLNTKLHMYNSSGQSIDLSAFYPQAPSTEPNVIDIHLVCGHYELLSGDNLNGPTQQYTWDKNNLPDVYNHLYDAISFNNSFVETTRALANVWVHVNYELNRCIHRHHAIANEQAQCMTAGQYFTLKDRFKEERGTEKQTSVIALLTLLQYEKNPDAERTLKYMKYALPAQRMQLTDAICTYWNSPDGLLHPEVQAIKANVQVHNNHASFYLGCMLALGFAGGALLLLAVLLNPISVPLSIVTACVAGSAITSGVLCFFKRQEDLTREAQVLSSGLSPVINT